MYFYNTIKQLITVIVTLTYYVCSGYPTNVVNIAINPPCILEKKTHQYSVLCVAICFYAFCLSYEMILLIFWAVHNFLSLREEY